MIETKEVIHIQNLLIQKYGGSPGIRDLNMLLSAISRPYQTFDGVDLYPTAIEKSAAICESLTINHPFIDGNKRIAYYMLVLLLDSGGLRITATAVQKRDLILEIAEGKLNHDDIVNWIRENTQAIP